MTPEEAGRIIGKPAQFVRVGLQQGRLPFGVAVKMSKRWSYHIVPAKVYEYMGGSSEEDK